jgi:hypothetical protein
MRLQQLLHWNLKFVSTETITNTEVSAPHWFHYTHLVQPPTCSCVSSSFTYRVSVSAAQNSKWTSVQGIQNVIITKKSSY